MNSIVFAKDYTVSGALSDAQKAILSAVSSPVNHDFAGLAGLLLGCIDLLSTQVNVKGEMTLYRMKKATKRMSKLCAGMSAINHMSTDKIVFDAVESLDALSVFFNSLFNKFNKTIDLSLSTKSAYINAPLDYFTCNIGYLCSYFLKHPSIGNFDHMTIKIQVQTIDDKLHIVFMPVVANGNLKITDENMQFFDYLVSSIGGTMKFDDYMGVKCCILTVVIPMLTNGAQYRPIALTDDVQCQQVA